MQRLRRTEHCAAERMGNHDVVANFDGKQENLPQTVRMSWQRRRSAGSRICGKRCGKSRNAHGRRKQARRGARRQAGRARQQAGARCVQRGRCDGAILPTWLDISRRRRLWNAPPSDTATGVVAIPAQLEHGRLFAGERNRGCKSGRASARVEDNVAVALRRLRLCKANTELPRQFRARRIDIDERHLRAGKSCAQRNATIAPTAPRADDRHPVGGSGAASHTALSAVSMLAASTARCGGTFSGTGTAASRGILNRV